MERDVAAVRDINARDDEFVPPTDLMRQGFNR